MSHMLVMLTRREQEQAEQQDIRVIRTGYEKDNFYVCELQHDNSNVIVNFLADIAYLNSAKRDKLASEYNKTHTQV